MSRITVVDLRKKVKELNARYKKTDRTAIKFGISSAYGGHQIVLINKKGRGHRNVTYGFQSPRETLNDLDKQMPYLSKKVKRAHNDEMRRRKQKWY